MALHHLEEVKQKYHSVLNAIEQQHGRVQELRMEGGKLLIRAIVPSAEAKDRVWDEIRLIDADYPDLLPDIRIAAGAAHVMPTPEPAVEEEYIDDADRVAQPDESSVPTYTVQPGDTLPKLAADFYGDAKQYMRIFHANRGQLNNPAEIKPGQRLIIPGGAVEEHEL